MNDQRNIQEDVLKAIQEGKIVKKSRAYFLARNIAIALTALLVLAGFEYIVSFILFLLRESGVAYALVFGVRGWLELWNAFPLAFLVLAVVLFFFLQWIVQRFSFAYRYAFSFSLAVMLVVMVGGSFLLDASAIHDAVFIAAERGQLPAPLSYLYKSAAQNTKQVLRGEIVAVQSGEWVVRTDAGTTTIVMTPETQLPSGTDFSEGDIVVIIADRTANGAIHAFGIRKIKRELLDQAK